MTTEELKHYCDFLDRTSDMDCPNCGRRRHRSAYLWKNGYGEKKRRFCDVCGCWWDYMVLWQNPPRYSLVIIRPGIQEGE
jgi:hypothetical protein